MRRQPRREGAHERTEVPTTARLVGAVLATVLLAAAAACSPAARDEVAGDNGAAVEDDDATARSDEQDPVADADEDGLLPGAPGRPGRGGRGGGGMGAGPGAGPGTGGAAGGGGGGRAASAIDPALRTASARVFEPQHNAQTGGAPPPYTELVAAAIEGLGDRFRITMRFAADLPARMPDENTFMVVAMGFEGRGDEQRYGFGAQGTQEGWNAYAGGANRAARRFPGTFEISGRDIRMTIPWRFIRGPWRFRWQATSSWFRSVANTTHYAFDLIPTDRKARFPNNQ